ncbi:MAG: SRPBCC domain-containing protein [Pseudonocardiales bacterium]|nr:SRPBCC domain-containing protein [Actinomycetota bacterium]
MPDQFRSDATVCLQREYSATPDEVWDAWTSPERLARWLGTPAGPVLGSPGPIRLRLGDGEDEWADVCVLRADPPRLLELTWTFVGAASSLLRVAIEPIDGTRTGLRVEHHGLGSAAVGYGAGWQAYLDGELAAELGQAVEGSGWDVRFERALPVWRERAAAGHGTSSATG